LNIWRTLPPSLIEFRPPWVAPHIYMWSVTSWDVSYSLPACLVCSWALSQAKRIEMPESAVLARVCLSFDVLGSVCPTFVPQWGSPRQFKKSNNVLYIKFTNRWYVYSLTHVPLVNVPWIYLLNYSCVLQTVQLYTWCLTHRLNNSSSVKFVSNLDQQSNTEQRAWTSKLYCVIFPTALHAIASRTVYIATIMHTRFHSVCTDYVLDESKI